MVRFINCPLYPLQLFSGGCTSHKRLGIERGQVSWGDDLVAGMRVYPERLGAVSDNQKVTQKTGRWAFLFYRGRDLAKGCQLLWRLVFDASLDNAFAQGDEAVRLLVLDVFGYGPGDNPFTMEAGESRSPKAMVGVSAYADTSGL